MRFDPKPGERIKIGENEHIFTLPPFPTALGMPFSSEGKKAIVYQLQRLKDEELYALKVFKDAYRGPYAVSSAKRLARYVSLPGMAGCNRTVLTKDRHSVLVQQFPELEYAVLMPWLGTGSWYDILLSGKELVLRQSLTLVQNTAALLASLEKLGVAHCDIAAPNIMVNIDNLNVHLIDLEDMFSPDVSPPQAYPQGTDGYQHRTSRTNKNGQWSAEGDRFSGAVLLAEMLAWHDNRVRSAAYGESFFATHEMQDTSSTRYRELLRVLKPTSSEIERLFKEAWHSPTLATCPSLADWLAATNRCVESHDLLEALDKAVQKDDSDRQILAVWQQSVQASRITNKFQKYERRVRMARSRVQALEKMEAALATRSVNQIIDIYRAHRGLLDICKDFASEDRKQTLALATFVDSLLRTLRRPDPDDEAIEELWHKRDTQWDWTDLLSSKDEKRLQLALDRMDAYRLMQVTKRRGDVAIVEVYERYQSIFANFVFVESDPRVQLARERVRALREFRETPPGQMLWYVYRQYYDLLEPCPDFSAEDRALLGATREQLVAQKKETLRQALWVDEDAAIEKAYEPDIFTDSLLFQPDDISDETKTRILLAKMRVEALNKLRAAFEAQDAELILQTYEDHESLLRRCSRFTSVDLLTVMRMRRQVLHNRLRSAVKTGSDDEIVSIAQKAIGYGCELDNQLLPAVRQARLRLMNA